MHTSRRVRRRSSRLRTTASCWIARCSTRAAALQDPDLIRTKINLVPPSIDPIRVIDIEGIDKQADGGTHVRSTGEVGRVRVIKTESKGKANKRMRIHLEDA